MSLPVLATTSDGIELRTGIRRRFVVFSLSVPTAPLVAGSSDNETVARRHLRQAAEFGRRAVLVHEGRIVRDTKAPR